MPNPPWRRDRGPCQTCNAYGGPVKGMEWATVCLRPKDSGKEVSRISEIGCFKWQLCAKPPS